MFYSDKLKFLNNAQNNFNVDISPSNILEKVALLYLQTSEHPFFITPGPFQIAFSHL
jgi:hypothetical protein